jgi:phospholipid N-methyltransferase
MRQRLTSLAKVQLNSLGVAFADFVYEMTSTACEAVLSAPLTLFGRALLANPRAVGACCPSSPSLAHAIALEVSIPCDGLVVELGGGTGAVTAALLRRGVVPEQLVVIEQDRLLAQHLKCRFPDVTIINGNAVRFSQLLNRGGRLIKTVVSSLPLLSLPSATVEDLGKELQAVIGREGTFIQYTYRLNNGPCPLSEYLERTAAKIVWGNLPPAKIEVFRQQT